MLILPPGYIPPEDFMLSSDFDSKPPRHSICRLRDRSFVPIFSNPAAEAPDDKTFRRMFAEVAPEIDGNAQPPEELN